LQKRIERFDLMNDMKSSTQNQEDNRRTIHINNFYSGRYATVRQLGHQFKVKSFLDEIDHSIDSLLQKTKAEIQTGDSIRVKDFFDGEGKFGLTADQEVDRELNVLNSRRNILSSRYINCPKCNQKIICCCHHDHDLVCLGIKTDVHEEIDENKTNLAFRPHPLRNLREIGVSCDAIKIAWDLPIFQGSEELIDFEISYSYEIYGEKKVERKREKFSCLQWCYKEPISSNCFVLDGLIASTPYSGIRMRCRNQIGWSDYSEAIDCIQTGGMHVNYFFFVYIRKTDFLTILMDSNCK
jgi:hypothetical protein